MRLWIVGGQSRYYVSFIRYSLAVGFKISDWDCGAGSQAPTDARLISRTYASNTSDGSVYRSSRELCWSLVQFNKLAM
jgi:hypothetical protein